MLYLEGNIYKFNSKEDMLHLVRNTKWATKHVLEFCDGVWDKYKNDDKEFCIRIAPPFDNGEYFFNHGSLNSYLSGGYEIQLYKPNKMSVELI